MCCSFFFCFSVCCFGCYCLCVLACTPICSYIHFFEGVLVRWDCLLEYFSLDDMFDSLLLMLSGMFLIMFGGWLLLLCTYRGVLLGFMYGLCAPVLKSIIMSRKSVVFLFASIVVLSSFSLKILHISVSLAVLLHVASPSSLYSPICLFLVFLAVKVGKCKQINF